MSPWLLTVLAAALLQSGFILPITFLGARPNLVLAVVLSWTLLRGGRSGLLWAAAGGVALDLLSSAPFGTFTVAILLTIGLIGMLDGFFYRPSILLPVALMVAASPLFDLLSLLMLRTLGWNRPLLSNLPLLLGAALLNGALIALVYPLMRRLDRLAGQPAIDWSQGTR